MYCRNCGKDVVATAEFCPNCGAKPSNGKSFCPACGTQTAALAEVCVKCGTRLSAAPAPMVAPVAGESTKSRLAAFLLALFLGEFGAHRFYTGKIGTAVVMLVLAIIGYATFIVVVGWFFLAAVWIWKLVDWIMIIAGNFKDKQGMLITKW